MAISGITNITFTSGSTDQTIENFINEKFGDYVTATHEVDGNYVYTHIKDKDNHEIMKLTLYGPTNTGIQAFNTSGQVYNYNITGSTGRWSLYSCTNGLLIRDMGDTSFESWSYISVNPDGKLIYGGSPTNTIGSASTSFYTIIWELSPYSTTATSRFAGSTSLLNLVYNGGYGEISIAENTYFALYTQYPCTTGVLNINDILYLTNGWFLIKDEG